MARHIWYYGGFNHAYRRTLRDKWPTHRSATLLGCMTRVLATRGLARFMRQGGLYPMIPEDWTCPAG